MTGEMQEADENCGEHGIVVPETAREWGPAADMEFDQAALLARGTTNSGDIELIRCLR